MKAFATDAIFVLVVIGLIVGAALIIFWKWINVQNKQASEIACRTKLYNYCQDLINDKASNWDDIEPKTGCEKFNVYKPKDKDECKKLFGL